MVPQPALAALHAAHALTADAENHRPCAGYHYIMFFALLGGGLLFLALLLYFTGDIEFQRAVRSCLVLFTCAMLCWLVVTAAASFHGRHRVPVLLISTILLLFAGAGRYCYDCCRRCCTSQEDVQLHAHNMRLVFDCCLGAAATVRATAAARCPAASFAAALVSSASIAHAGCCCCACTAVRRPAAETGQAC